MWFVSGNRIKKLSKKNIFLKNDFDRNSSYNCLKNGTNYMLGVQIYKCEYKLRENLVYVCEQHSLLKKLLQ